MNELKNPQKIIKRAISIIKGKNLMTKDELAKLTAFLTDVKSSKQTKTSDKLEK